MMHALLPFFQWADASWLGGVIRGSRIYFPIIETFHLLSLTLLFGAVIVIDLRALGLIMRSQPISRVSRDLAPWTFWNLVIILTSGFMLFLSEAMKCYGSQPFQIKMLFLFSAIAFHFTIHRYVTRRDDSSPILAGFAAVISMALWLGVGLGGRAIGFL